MKLLGSCLVITICLMMTPQSSHTQPNTSLPSATNVQNASGTQTTQYTLPPDKLAKSTALYDLRGKLRIIDTLYGLAVLCGLLYLGIAGKFRDIAEATG